MKTNSPTMLRLLALVVFGLFGFIALWSCKPATEGEVEEVFTFPTLADSLAGSDHAIIFLTDPQGEVIDTLFNGPVTSTTRFEELVARNYQGGRATVVIEGYKGGTLNYKIEKHFDGTAGKVDTTLIIVPRPVAGAKVDSVTVGPDTLRIKALGPQESLQARVHPSTSSQAVSWKSLNDSIATVSSTGRVSGLLVGTTRVVAASVLDARASDTTVVVVDSSIEVKSVRFDRAMLEVYLGGSPIPISVQVLPEGADPDVDFQVTEPGVAIVSEGKVKGLQEGRTSVIVHSRADSSLTDTLVVIVLPKPSAAVDSVTVSPDTLRLFTGGEALSLTAAIHPETLPPRFAWRSALPGIATVDTAGKVRPVAAGRTYVSAFSLADSTRRDSALVLVRTDPPRIQIGRDTTISVGQTLTYLPVITQDYGSITVVRWDLDGNGAWDDSSTAPKAVSYRYAEAKEYTTRFSARDSEGNDTTVTRKVWSVSGPVILFTQPADGAYTNQSPIAVTWSVDGVVQTASEALKPGANVITRSASVAGQTFSASITVHYDTVPPSRPLVKGSMGPVSSLRPAWSWEPAGGGNGTFRFRLDSDNFTVGATMVTDTTFTPGANLTGGPHTLYVQERDMAGNWSPTGSFTVRIDTTAPPPPVVTVLPASPTNNRRPTWSWTGSVSEGRSSYRYKLNNSDFRTGATLVSTTGFTPAPGAELLEGPHVLYVQHQDSAGNWSAEGSAQVRIDLTAPTAPTVNGPASPTSDDTPTWTWTAGTGGNGAFRYRLDDTSMAGGTETSQLSYTPAALASGRHTLHVQERDSAGNWSPRGSYSVVLDRTPPNPPTMNVSTPRSPLNTLRPTWSWTSGGGGNGTYQVKVGDNDFSTGATTITATSYTPPANLGQGTQTLYVRERDTAQNWSTAASRTIFLAPRDTLGRRGFSGGEYSSPMLLVTSTGVVYAAYSSPTVFPAAVKRYQPETDSWVDAGTGLDMGRVYDFSMAPGDVPYIVGSGEAGFHVKRLVGSAWQDVGRPEDNAKSLAGNYHSLAVSSLGIPYLAFTEDNQAQATLMRFSGTDWRLAKSTRVGTPCYLDMAIGANDRPYLGFQDVNDMGVYVVTTDPNNAFSKWDTVGLAPAFRTSIISGMRVRANSNQVYLGLYCQGAEEGIQVLVSNGGKFTSLHSVEGYGSDFDVSPAGVPYLALIQSALSGRLVVMGYFGSSWINIGAEFEFANGISMPNLAVNGDGVPYVGFKDEAAGGNPSVIRTSFDPNQ